MLSELKLINLQPNTPIMDYCEGDVFTIKTCQRTMVLGFNFIPSLLVDPKVRDYEVIIGENAYQFLLETICGLKSKMLGENEIVGQFKQAYEEFLKLPHHNPHIMTVLEKLFKDAKEIRSNYLLEIGQQSYAGVTKRLLQANTNKGQQIVIFGSGQLAEDCIKLLARHFKLTICARNEQKVSELIKKYPQYSLNTIPWTNRQECSKEAYIVNTIGCSRPIFKEDFFNDWITLNAKLFIDLGSPCALKTDYGTKEDIIRLEDVFKFSQSFDKEKNEKINSAKLAINGLVEKRKTTFTINFPFGWEELQFA